jgi:hypothetical protein
MIKRSSIFAATLGVAAMLNSTAALSGEIKGPPPGSNTDTPPGPLTRISNGVSICSFSGLNDTPDGIPGVDPGGIVQSYGFFMAQFGLFDPSDPEERASFDFPGTGCNPNHGVRLPH